MANAIKLTRVFNHYNCDMAAIDHLHASENILIEQLIAVTSRLDAVVAHKMYCNQWESDDRRQLNSRHKRNIRYNPILRTTLGRQ